MGINELLSHFTSKDGARFTTLWTTAGENRRTVKNNVPQRTIARNLGISSSTVHNIIKRFRESGKSLHVSGKAENQP